MLKTPLEEYALRLAEHKSASAGCIRCSVGAVLYDPLCGGMILGTGFNHRLGPVEGPCPRASSTVPSGSSYVAGSPGACDAIHAEEDALSMARYWHGAERIQGAHMAVNLAPCEPCVVLMRWAGVQRVIHPGGAIWIARLSA